MGNFGKHRANPRPGHDELDNLDGDVVQSLSTRSSSCHIHGREGRPHAQADDLDLDREKQQQQAASSSMDGIDEENEDVWDMMSSTTTSSSPRAQVPELPGKGRWWCTCSSNREV